jgi:hypothetical protein
MPSNTDNSGSARAARLRQISASKGPVPVQRPNIGSMALDARLGGGQNPTCCPTVDGPGPIPPPASSYPTYYLPCVDDSLANTFPPEGSLPEPGTPFYIDALDEPGTGLIQLTCQPSGDIILANTGLPYLVASGLPLDTTDVTYAYLCNSVFLLVNCGIGPQALSPFIGYEFVNNISTTDFTVDSTGSVVLLLTDSNNNTTTVELDAFAVTVEPYTNLVSWQSDQLGAECAATQYVQVFDTNTPLGCITQQLNSSATYYFGAPMEGMDPITFPLSINLTQAGPTNTTITLTGYDILYGPYTNCMSWSSFC